MGVSVSLAGVLESVLVANRGEIALRVIRTCRKHGVRSIAIFTDLDVDAPHVRAADDAIRVESYLDVDAVVAAAVATGAAAARPMPSTRRVSAGSMMPSSQSRAVE